MQQLQITGARIAIDLGIFEAINESKAPLNVEQLAAKTGAAPELLGKSRNMAPHRLENWSCAGRILRYLASEGQIKETSKDHFGSSSITPVLAEKNYQGGIRHL